MSVSSHLGIALAEYDARIRTFIPYYEEMIDLAARIAAAGRPRVVVDLGTGTGALAARIGRLAPGARLVGIDEDAGMIAAASRRLGRRRATFVHDTFLRAPLPRCDSISASLALHHVASPRRKRAFFARAAAALRSGGVLVSADCHPSALAGRAAADREAWLAFLARTYGSRGARQYLDAWSGEDFYTTLSDEIRLLRAAGFDTDVAWRRDSFAVVVAQPRTTAPAPRRATR